MADLTSGIVRILDSNRKTVGTGFVVAEDLAVTCAHVISEAAPPKDGHAGADVELVFRAGGGRALASVVQEWLRPAEAEDVAFLRLKEPLPEGVRPLPLGSSQGASGHLFQTFGFPSASPEEGIRGDGHILGETLMQSMRVLQLSSPQITTGFSGAPVFDAVTRRVVGMVNAIAPQDGYGRLAETAFMIPAETLRLICPCLVLSDDQPYLGLSAFKESDAEFFFGRSREVEWLLDALRREPRFLAVLGPSGSGKSSVVQAGLIPELRRGGLPGSDRWEIITARPGERPLQNLEAAGLEEASSGLARAARGWLADHPDKSRLIIVLDQFEELLAVASPPVRQDFLNCLRELLEADLSLTLILVMRDEFFSRFAEEAPSGLFEWMQRGFVHLSANLEEDDLRRIITGPAEKVGLKFEDGLVDVICKDVMETTGEEKRGSRSTMLPLLEFALTDLWMRRRDGYLTHEAYKAIGGVTGSLTQRADQAYQSLAGEGLEDVARRVLTELVSLGAEGSTQDSKRRMDLDKIIKDPGEREKVQKVLDRLADPNARLVITSYDDQSSTTHAELVHDSLIREWGRLRQWLKEDRSFIAWRRETERSAQAWMDGKHGLLYDIDLDEAQRWLSQRSGDIGQGEREYIRASLALREKESREREQRRRRIILGLAGFSALALLLAGAAVWQWNLAEEKSEEALALYLASQSEQIKGSTGSDYMRKVLLAVESLRLKETAVGDLALRSSAALLSPPLVQIDHNDTVSAVAFSPDGSLVLTGSWDSTARIWDAASGQEFYKLPHNNAIVLAVAFSPDGSKVLTGSTDGSARIWDATRGKEIHELPHNSIVLAVAFSPDGSKVLTGSGDNTARIWDAASGQEIHKLPHNSIVLAVAFSPDGSRAVTGGYDREARIWDATSGQELHRLPHEGPVNSVDFSPDGSQVLTGSYDREARIWDATSGLELHRLPHESSINCLDFSSDGSSVVTGIADGTAWIWPVSDRDLIKQTCDCMSENFTIEQWQIYGISDPRTCPKEGSLNQSALARFLKNPKRFLIGSAECQPCIAEGFQNRK